MEAASIIIANHNQAVFLRECIDSALSQTLEAEVVVVDDGSVDASADVIRSYGDRVVSVLKEWRGQAAAINQGIAASSGSILFFLDADDASDPDRVSRIVPLFESNADLFWVRHSLRAIHAAGAVIHEDLYRFGDPGSILREVIAAGRTAGTTSGLVFRKRFFEEFGSIPENYTTYPDSYLLMAGAVVGRGVSVQRALGTHRWHGSSSTAYHWKEFQRAAFHINLRRSLAGNARNMAVRVGGPEQLAAGLTWWQLKAELDWRKADLGQDADDWSRLFLPTIKAIMSSELSAGRKLVIAGRTIALGLVPKRLYLPAWWMTHEGRPGPIGRGRTRRR